MATITDLIDDTFTLHLSQYGPSQVLLTSDVLDDEPGPSTFDVDREPAHLAPGMLLECETGEVLSVLRRHENHLEVRRGMLNTTIAEHAAGTAVAVNPRFFRRQALLEMIAELTSWDQQLFTTRTATVPWPSGASEVELPDPVGYEPIRVLTANIFDTPVNWTVTGSIEIRPDTRYDTGWKLWSLRNGDWGSAVDIVYAAGFKTDTLDLDTNLTTVGLTPGMHEILRLGTVARLLRSDEIVRTGLTAQGQPRTPEEVPPQHLQQLADAYQDQRDERYDAERDRLRMAWGVT